MIMFTSCSSLRNFDRTLPYSDGNGVVLDTEENRRYYFDVFTERINEEKSEYPEKTAFWNRWWCQRVKSLTYRRMKNPKPIIDYIIAERRKRGLPELDYKKAIKPDTEENRREYFDIYRRLINSEKSSYSKVRIPWDKRKENSWNLRWSRVIYDLKNTRLLENPQPIIDYIIEERRRQGLPELRLE